MENHKSTSTKVKTFWGAFLAFIVVCIIGILFSFQYYQNLHSTIRSESKGYLQEVSRRIGSNIDHIIEVNFAGLNTMATIFEADDEHALSSLKPIMEKQLSFWDYESVMLVDEKGKLFGLDKNEIFLNMDDELRKSILKQEQAMCTAQIINNAEYILFSVPLNDVVVDGKNMIALVASYAPTSFDQTLSMTSFDDKSYSQIVTKEGTTVTRPTAEDNIKMGYNVFASLEEAEFDEDSDMSQMKADIGENKAGQVGFTLNGEHRYMVYMPINPEDWYLLTYVPVEVVNEKSDLLLESTVVICCFITVIFVILLGAILVIFNVNKRRLEKIAYVDEITGGNNLKRFYEMAGDMINSSGNTRYALIYTNIQNFKVLNEQLGRENCDNMLRQFNDIISESLERDECLARIAADNFCILLKYEGEDDIIERFTCWFNKAEAQIKEQNMLWTIPYTEFGIYVIENRSLTFPQMIDRAKLALTESTRTLESKMRYGFYDEQARRRLFREKQLEDMMTDALEQGQFQVYLQPKYRIPEEVVGGAEALVRWQSPQEGMIYPDEFISLFEKNGFIVQLDIWVFREVCKSIRSWKERGFPIVKVSVNCSRVHFKDSDFMAPYVKIAREYGIEAGEIEIELTESLWLNSEDVLLKAIGKIREAGFGCSMDDFGSGYSSLNMIQSIPVDTLKIDKIFFHGDYAESTRTEAVVGSIIKMSKDLNMVTVAEGVEYREQVEMLKRTGCDFIQGYVYAKPMPIREFEELAFGQYITERS